MSLPPPTKNGFSLVELSIVLVILGLLVGGVLSGQSLIKAAELRATTNQIAQYRTAISSFRDKYFALPGDMTNATAFWVSAGGVGNDSACFSAQTQGAIATCNGDGDGFIYGFMSLAYVERFTAWKQLANAGLVEGSYTGKSTGAIGSYGFSLGTNLPAAKIGNAYFDLSWIDPLATAPAGWQFSVSRTNVNVIGVYGTSTIQGALAPEDAWNIDTKFDDGSPVYGIFFTSKKTATIGTNCATSDTNTATYDFTVTSKNCPLFSVL